MLRNADWGRGGGGRWGWGVSDFLEKSYEGVMFNVISVTRWWVGVHFPGK